MNSTTNQTLKVGLLGHKILGWVCIIFFFGCSAGAYLAKQYGPSAFFWVFILTGVYMLMTSGTFEIDEDGLSHKNLMGHYRMLWSDVQRIEEGPQGSLVLHGEGKRFVLAPPSFWSGPDKAQAFTLANRKVIELAITPTLSNLADYKAHKNVKIRRAAD